MPNTQLQNSLAIPEPNMREAAETFGSSTPADEEKVLGQPSPPVDAETTPGGPSTPPGDGPPETEYPGFKALALILLAIYLSVFLVALVSPRPILLSTNIDPDLVAGQNHHSDSGMLKFKPFVPYLCCLYKQTLALTRSLQYVPSVIPFLNIYLKRPYAFPD